MVENEKFDSLFCITKNYTQQCIYKIGEIAVNSGAVARFNFLTV